MSQAISAIATSPDDSLIVVGGRDILKLVSSGPSGLKDLKNLRINRKKSLDLAVCDVKWHPTNAGVVATGSTSGAVLVFDVNKTKGGAASELSVKHDRTVNRVTWHPTQHWLLTCGQDGFARLWDARAQCSGSSFVAGYR